MLNTRLQCLKDFKWALGLNRLSLRLMGVWPDDDEDQGPRRLLVLLRVPFMITAMVLCLLLPQMYALIVITSLKELPLIIDNLITSLATAISCFKLFFMWQSKKVLRPVIKSVTEDWLRPKLTWERDAMMREALRARRFTISGYAIMAGCYAGFAVGPLLGFSVRILSNITDYGKHHLLVQSYFPYDYSKSPYFEITYTCQFIASSFIGMSMSIPDNYFAALVFHLSAQYKILGINMNNLKGDDKGFHNDDKFNAYSRRMKIFVDRHVHLMTIVTAIEYSFRLLMLAQIFCMLIIVGLLGCQVVLSFQAASGGQSSKLQVLTLTVTFFTLMMLTLVDCIASELLELRSSNIFRNIYNIKWYDAPLRSRKDVLLVMVISKIPRKLTAGNIFILSLSTYCSLMKSTVGYISMLIAINRR